MIPKYIELENAKEQYRLLKNKLLLKPNTATVLRDMDKLEGLFLIMHCDHRVLFKEGDALNYICKHGRLHGANCALRACPL